MSSAGLLGSVTDLHSSCCTSDCELNYSTGLSGPVTVSDCELNYSTGLSGPVTVIYAEFVVPET